LFTVGGNPETTRVALHPWKIVVTESPELGTKSAVATPVERPETQIDMPYLQQLLNFSYPYEAATRTPSKQTATQIKGRLKDREVTQHAEEPKPVSRSWRSIAFGKKATDGIGYGNAIHTVMQRIRYEACTSVSGIRAEIQRMLDAGFLTPEQIKLIHSEKFAAFFASDFGRKLINGGEVLREFKFSILEDAADYGENLTGERVLLQGVVDCALVEEDGISIVDFKTDHATQENLDQIRDRYAMQIETYASALSRIFAKPIKLKALYLFSIGEFLYL
jgi:ATP-dependent helicase/nuclease subunit A